MIPALRKRFGSLLSAAALLATSTGFAVGTTEDALGAIRVPGSDLEIRVDVAKSQQSAFQKEMKVLQKEMEAEADAEALAVSKKLEEIMKSIGLSEDTVESFTVSLSIRGIVTDGPTPKIPGLVAFAVKEPLSATKIAAGVKAAAEEEGETVELTESAYKGVPVLTLKLDPEKLPEGMDEEARALANDLFLALPANGSVVYLGQSEYVKAGVDRMLGEQSVVPLSEGLSVAKKLVPAEADGYAIFDMPDQFREFMSKQAANAQGNPMAAAPAMALAGLKGAAFSGITTDKASLALAGDFETADNAMMMKTTIDGVLGMIKMQLMSMGGGKPLPLAESLKTSLDETKTTLTFDITVEDIRSMIEFSKKMKANAMGGDAPHGAPGGVPAP
jgi:hypothetical protein